MQKYEFYQLDVFTDKKFSGNPLAVFPEAAGLQDSDMQKIANEMNLSETVFVFDSEKALRRLRIFTPKQELPLAGHPCVGTWFLLAHLGVTPETENGIIEIEQELNLGVLPVEVEFKDGKVLRTTMTQDKFQSFEKIDKDADIARLAEGLGIATEEISTKVDLPIQIVSTGIKTLAVPVRSVESLKKCKINSSLLSEVYLQFGAVGVYVFSFETIEENSKVHARFFAPDDGIAEDPATGSAAGSLAGYLTFYGAISEKEFVIEQGDFMNRPSRISAKISGEKGNVEKVQIGGSSVIVAKGEVYVD